MKIGFTTVTFRDKSIEEIFEIAKDNDVKIIEWGGDIHLKFDDDIALNKVLQLSKKYDIQSYSYGSYFRIGKDQTAKFEQICKVTNAIGAKVVRIWIGDKSSRWVSKKCFLAMAKELVEACKIAQKYELIVAGEFHQGTYNDCGKSCNKMLKAVGMPNFKTYWQPLGGESKDLSNLQLVVENVVVAHIFNWKNFDTRYEFEYNCDRWKKFFDILSSNNQVVGIMEFVKDDSVAQFAKDCKLIKSMAKEEL